MGRTGQERTRYKYRSSVRSRGEPSRASTHSRGDLGLQVADVVAALADVLLVLMHRVGETRQQ